MAEQILSQVEVDALLKGLSDGEIATETNGAGDAPDASTYDFRNQTKMLKGKLPTLDMVNEKFCRNARTSLFNLLRKGIDVTPGGVKTMKYSDFVTNLKVPASLNIFQSPPLRGQAILSIDPDLVFIIVDSYFGGDGRFHARVEGRDFTNVEQAVIKKIVGVLLGEMSAVWKPIKVVENKLVRAEMNPQFANVIGASELVITSTFKMEVEALSSEFTFCMPFSMLEPVMDKLYGLSQDEGEGADGTWSKRLRDEVRNIPITLWGEIGTAEITVSDIMNLKLGDVIQLDKKAKDPIDVYVEGVRKFNGRPGIMDNNYSIQISSHTK